MADPNFRRAVVLLCDHQKEGAVGFILNKPVGLSIQSLLSDFPDFDTEVYYGGPVQTDTIHYLHTKGDIIPDSQPVLDDICWGGDFEQVKELIRRGQIAPNEIRFFVGYSGWSRDQLKIELREKSWLSATGWHEAVFHTRKQGLWKHVLETQGDIYSVLAQIPKKLIWN